MSWLLTILSLSAQLQSNLLSHFDSKLLMRVYSFTVIKQLNFDHRKIKLKLFTRSLHCNRILNYFSQKYAPSIKNLSILYQFPHYTLVHLVVDWSHTNRMLFAPTCLCTSVLFAMRMISAVSGWSTTPSLLNGVTCHEVGPASTN